jgi:hypothetical protein
MYESVATKVDVDNGVDDARKVLGDVCFYSQRHAL